MLNVWSGISRPGDHKNVELFFCGHRDETDAIDIKDKKGASEDSGPGCRKDFEYHNPWSSYPKHFNWPATNNFAD